MYGRMSHVPTRRGHAMAFSKDQKAAAITDYWQRQDGALTCPGCGDLLPADHTLQSHHYLLVAMCPRGCGTLSIHSALDDPLYNTFRDLTADEWEAVCQEFDATGRATCP